MVTLFARWEIIVNKIDKTVMIIAYFIVMFALKFSAKDARNSRYILEL